MFGVLSLLTFLKINPNKFNCNLEEKILLFSNISILQVLSTLEAVGNRIETVFLLSFTNRLKIINNLSAFLYTGIFTSLLCSDC